MFRSWIRENPFFLPFFCLVFTCLFLLSQFNFLLFHTSAESFSILVSMAIFIIAWNARWRTGDHYLLVLGTGFMCFAILDFLHSLAYKGMGVFPYAGANLPTQLWIAGRYLQAAAFIGAPLFFSRRVKPWILLLNAIAITGLFIVFIFLGLFPDCYVEGQGLTMFKILSEGVVCVALAASVVILHWKGSPLDRTVRLLIQASIILTIFQELAFMLYVDVLGIYNVVGHFIKILASYLIYKAVLETGLREPQRVLFMELERGRRLLTEAEQRYRTISDGAPVGIFRSTPDGRYEYANPRLVELYGYDSPSELINSVNHIGNDLHIEPHRWANMRKRLEHEDVVCDVQAPIRRKDGSTIWTSRDVRAHRDLRGKMLYFDGFVTDITDQKKLESLREDVERILRHDLKSPIISLTSGLAMVRATCRPNHRGQVLINEMEGSAMQMLGLIDLSMGLHKMESGEYELEPTPVELFGLLRQVQSEHRSILRSKELHLQLQLNGKAVEPEAQCEVVAEGPLCHALISNLVRNALEAAPKGESVSVNIDTSTPPSLTVHNSGEVPVEVRNNFFGKYTTHGKPHGTGLGTYSALLIAETHGWSVGMSTGDGTTSVRIQFTAED